MNRNVLTHGAHRPWRALIACLFSVWTAAAHAQPVSPATVQPPARVDVGLRGTVLAGAQVQSHGECLTQCRRSGGCTGWNFAGGAAVLPRPAPGGLAPQPSNCTLFSGALTDVAMKSVVSCRMPCDAKAAGAAGTARPGAVATLQPQAEATLQPPRAPLLSSGGTATPGTVVPARPPLTTAGTYTPPPAPGAGTAAPAPAPAPAPTRARISGYVVVPGPELTVAPLSHVTATAQCPDGKVALSAGYRFLAGGDASFGLEVRGAIPDGREARVLMRNANVAVSARAQALAVCVNAIAGLRSVDSEVFAGSQAAGDARMTCNAGERVVGGGAMSTLNGMFGINAPQGGAADGAWSVKLASSTPVPAVRVSASVRVLCAPEAQVDGWELVQSAAQSLGARSQTTLTQACPGGKALLAAGVVQGSNNLLDMVGNTLEPQNGTLAWAAHLHNRNVLGGGGTVNAALAAVCALRQ